MKVLVVGAGFSGLCAAVKLSQAGISYTIIEKAPDVGGTWYYNTVVFYLQQYSSSWRGLTLCFSFAPKADWSRTYSTQPELLAYLRDIATRFNIYSNIKLNTEVTSARFDTSLRKWRVLTKGGEELLGDVLIGAQGFLHVPCTPYIKGAEAYKGEVVHTANWNQSFNPNGKRVCVIGSAASAVQLVPELAKSATTVTVFQRSPNWFVPKEDAPYSGTFQFLFRWMPLFRLLYRWLLYWRHEMQLFAFGHQTFIGKYARRLLSEFLSIRLRSKPDLVPIMTPTYPPGCKRIVLDSNFLSTLTQPHVKLVTTPIDELTHSGIKSAGHLFAADVIVYATGFAGAQSFASYYGTDSTKVKFFLFYSSDRIHTCFPNLSLGEVWGEEPFAHLGITVPNFPNLFLLLGPNTGLRFVQSGRGHNSVVWMIECQMNYVTQCIKLLLRNEDIPRVMTVREDATATWLKSVYAKLSASVWSRRNCRSWYQSARGTVFALWPGATFSYWWATRSPNAADFEFA